MLPPQLLSPLDTRYRAPMEPLGEYLSEAALNRARVLLEIEWLIFLTDRGIAGSSALSDEQQRSLRQIPDAFGQEDIDELAALERTTRHDVKAVEYYVRARLEALGLSRYAELTHFACTSEDINNLAYAITIRDAVNRVWLPAATALADRFAELAEQYRHTAMLSLTHGQPATPTTLGKEFAVYAHRIRRQLRRVQSTEYLGKFAGATGNFAAHRVVDADLDWPALAAEFVGGLGLTWNPLTTQIESHDWQAELYQAVSHCNRVLHNICTDIWTYISRGIFRQIPQPGTTGSSTMPHKINPIRFENAESNLELSSAILDSLAATLVTSRMQRDLTDSSAQRNIGVGFGHSLLAIDNMTRGLGEIAVDEDALHRELDGNWEVLGEAIQTVIRAEIVAGRSQVSDPYAVLKELTRGQRVSAEELARFVDGLDVSDAAKAKLKALTPATYTGDSSALVDALER